MNAAESCERVTAIYEKAITDLDAVKPGDIEVTFRLIGALEATQDVDLTKDSYLPEYVTWVPTKTYALQENATVYDLFTEAMSDAGLRYIDGAGKRGGAHQLSRPIRFGATVSTRIRA